MVIFVQVLRNLLFFHGKPPLQPSLRPVRTSSTSPAPFVQAVLCGQLYRALLPQGLAWPSDHCADWGTSVSVQSLQGTL